MWHYPLNCNCQLHSILTGNCEVPTLPEGRLIDPWTGMTLVPGTITLMNGEDAARMRCPAGTYALGRVRIACHDGEITHPLPICTSNGIHDISSLKLNEGIINIF